MEERSQGVVEYLFMVAAALVIVAGITYMIFTSSLGMKEDIESSIDNIKKNLIEILT